MLMNFLSPVSWDGMFTKRSPFQFWWRTSISKTLFSGIRKTCRFLIADRIAVSECKHVDTQISTCRQLTTFRNYSRCNGFVILGFRKEPEYNHVLAKWKVFLCTARRHMVRRGLPLSIHSLGTNGGELAASRSGCLTCGKVLCSHWRGVWCSAEPVCIVWRKVSCHCRDPNYDSLISSL